jgi:hypothetical protein
MLKEKDIPVYMNTFIEAMPTPLSDPESKIIDPHEITSHGNAQLKVVRFDWNT